MHLTEKMTGMCYTNPRAQKSQNIEGKKEGKHLYWGKNT